MRMSGPSKGNAIIRGLNSIYVQVTHVKPDDYADFIGYSLCWSELLHLHHAGEELIFLPGIGAGAGEKGLINAKIHQHEEFHPGSEAYKHYLLEVQQAPTTFSGIHLCEIVDPFAPTLTAHLTTEIPTLLALGQFGDKFDIIALWEEDGKTGMGAGSKTSMIPFCFLNLDITFEGGKWASCPEELPAPIRWIFTHVYTWPNRAYWKFSPCDYNGRPKDLHAVEG